MMKQITNNHTHLVILSAALTLLLLGLFTQTSDAQESMPCSGDFLITHTFANGAAWEMCWEERLNEGIVYHDIYYTTAHGLRRKVLGQMNVAQIHVPYDTSEKRFHDASDYGFASINSSGASNLLTLRGGECLDGQLYANGEGRNVVCKQAHDHGYAWKDYVDYGMKETATIFNVSRVQRYFYIMAYEFHDDGEIHPSVAASGRLQQYIYTSSTSWDNPGQYGWEIYELTANGPVYGVNHTHNYWWRLDFDLGGAANDVFEEIEFLPESNNFRRIMTTTTYTTEVGRQTSPDTLRSWRVKDTVLNNIEGHPISYDILPDGTNVYRGPTNEPWTQNDIYATNNKPCERFISHNTRVAGCDDNVAQFTNGEVMTDTVVWYGVTFHHLVRDEDDQRMPAHAEGFHLVPRDWTAENPVDMNPLANTAVQFSETVQADRPFANISTNLFLLAASFVFVVGTVMARQVTRNR